MGVELIYNVVLVSGVQQSDSVIHSPILYSQKYPANLRQVSVRVRTPMYRLQFSYSCTVCELWISAA